MMAIDKELYQRYKELKAQGVNITLAELKAGTGVNNIPSVGATSQSQSDYSVNAVANQGATPQSRLSYGANVASNQGETSKSQELNNISGSGVNSNSAYSSDTQNSSWTTSYTQNQAPYQGNVNTTSCQNSYYMSQFAPSNNVSQTNPQPVEFHGNITQTEVPQVQTGTKFGLLGYPLGHSLSTYIHEAGFKSLGLDYTYELLETSPENLVDRIKSLKYNNYAGFNVTIPLKLPVTMFLDEIDSSSDLVGAVNTVVINPDKTLKGYNTDVIGFRNAIPEDIVLQGKNAGVLGTGGAARAAIAALVGMEIKSIKIFTRNIPNSLGLLKYLEEHYTNTEFNVYQIEHIRNLSDIDILVNCTPIGMQGRGADYTPVEEKELCTLPQGAVVYDVIYNPKRTVLLKLAQKNGYRTINGLDMLVSQAVEAEKIWTGRTPDFKDMKIAALENL